MKEIDELRDIFVAQAKDGLDPQEVAENEEQIQEWECKIIDSRALMSWRGHPITQEIATQAKASYIELNVLLATNRNLTDKERHSLWGKVDAMLWILSITERDGRAMLEEITQKIRAAINATK